MPRDEWERARRRDISRQHWKYPKVSQQLPKKKKRKKSRSSASAFVVEAGTLVSVCKASDPARKWLPHTTKHRSRFDRYQSYLSGAYVFRRDGWLMLVRRDKVRKI